MHFRKETIRWGKKGLTSQPQNTHFIGCLLKGKKDNLIKKTTNKLGIMAIPYTS